MDSNPPPHERPHRRFATTRWSVILAARERGSPLARRALSELCRTYWYPIYAYARRCDLGPDDASDAVQGFFAHLLDKDSLRHVDPDKGRFRSFLLTSFRNHLADERKRQRARKRGGGVPPVPFEADDAEERYAIEPSHELTPERLFERRWAVTVLDTVLRRLGEEHRGRGRGPVFEAIKVHLTGEPDAESQAQTAARLGVSEVTVRVAVHRLRRRYRELLLDEISQTLGSEEELSSELDHLFQALAGDEPPSVTFRRGSR